jgi:hypothetical protein
MSENNNQGAPVNPAHPAPSPKPRNFGGVIPGTLSGGRFERQQIKSEDEQIRDLVNSMDGPAFRKWLAADPSRKQQVERAFNKGGSR